MYDQERLDGRGLDPPLPVERVSVTQAEGLHAARLIVMVIRGEIVRTEHSLIVVAEAVKTIEAYNDLAPAS